MQPINLTNVKSAVLVGAFDKPITISVDTLKTIFELGIDVRDKILALSDDELPNENEALKERVKELEDAAIIDLTFNKVFNTRNKELEERVKVLEGALQGIIDNWDERMSGDKEVWKDGSNSVPGFGYYSPSSSMVSSEFIAKGREALSTPTQEVGAFTVD